MDKFRDIDEYVSLESIRQSVEISGADETETKSALDAIQLSRVQFVVNAAAEQLRRSRSAIEFIPNWRGRLGRLVTARDEAHFKVEISQEPAFLLWLKSIPGIDGFDEEYWQKNADELGEFTSETFVRRALSNLRSAAVFYVDGVDTVDDDALKKFESRKQCWGIGEILLNPTAGKALAINVIEPAKFFECAFHDTDKTSNFGLESAKALMTVVYLQQQQNNSRT